jgi:hypothetical protein
LDIDNAQLPSGASREKDIAVYGIEPYDERDGQREMGERVLDIVMDRGSRQV